MGWLDKLLGRSEKAEAPAEAPAPPQAPPAPEMPAGEAEREAEPPRDEATETENRLPPGTG